MTAIPETLPAVPPQEIGPDTRAVMNAAADLMAQAESAVIVTPEDYQARGADLNEIKRRMKALEEKRLSLTRPLDAAKKGIMDLFRTPIETLNNAATVLNMKLVTWTNEQERKRREEESRIQEELRKREEEERLQAAIEAEQAGETAEAAKILETPAPVAPVKLASTVPSSAALHTRETWSADGTDLMATVKAIAAGKAPLQAVQFDMVFLNQQARAYKSAMNIPGVRAVSKKGMAGRG